MAGGLWADSDEFCYVEYSDKANHCKKGDIMFLSDYTTRSQSEKIAKYCRLDSGFTVSRNPVYRDDNTSRGALDKSHYTAVCVYRGGERIGFDKHLYYYKD